MYIRSLYLIGLFTFFATKSVAQYTKEPSVFLNAKLLQLNKEHIRKGNQKLTAAKKDVLAQADKALLNPTYSVVDKKKVPPSGDKHDYMSVGPYWWPDSSKADGLPYVRRDGQINPERFSITDADYLKALCSDVELLTTAYYFSNDEKYARRAAKLLRVWFLNPATRMNPNLNFGQAIPGVTQGRGIGLIDTRALAKLTNGIQLLKGSNEWPQADHKALQDWFRQFLNWMQTSSIGKEEANELNNHGTYYDVQTITFCLFLNDKDRAKALIEQHTVKRIQSQLTADGSQPRELARTLSWDYSVMNLTGLFVLAELAENVQIDLWRYQPVDGGSIKNAFLWLLPYAEGKKTWTYQQIKPINTKEFERLKVVASRVYQSAESSAFTTTSQVNDSLFLLINGLL